MPSIKYYFLHAKGELPHDWPKLKKEAVGLIQEFHADPPAAEIMNGRGILFGSGNHKLAEELVKKIGDGFIVDKISENTFVEKTMREPIPDRRQRRPAW